jgi:hypothetical protein
MESGWNCSYWCFGNKTAALLPEAEYIVYNGAPHGLFLTEKEKLYWFTQFYYKINLVF